MFQMRGEGIWERGGVVVCIELGPRVYGLKDFHVDMVLLKSELGLDRDPKGSVGDPDGSPGILGWIADKGVSRGVVSLSKCQ